MSSVLRQAWGDYEQGRYEAALHGAKAVLTLAPEQPIALGLKAMCQMWLTGDVAGSVRGVKRALKLAPKAPLLHHNLGTLYSFSGDMARAESAFETALALDPGNFGTFYNLALVKKHSALDARSVQMEEIAAAGDLPPEKAAPLHFALAKIFADIGAHEKAFSHVLKANAASGGHYNPQESERHLDSLLALRSSGTFPKLPGSGNGSARPLFIVGMPRSGTTLVESILGRHSQVRPCGELPDILNIERELTETMSRAAGRSLTPLQALLAAGPEELRPHAEAMLKKVHDSGQGTYRIFTDKMPPNGLRLGLIARLFPKARVIIMQRDAMDCCVSNLFARLPAAYAYTRRLDWLGHYAGYFASAVRVWSDIVDLEIKTVAYEELAADPEPVVRGMLEFAGLAFEPSCLHPERGNTSIKTASVWQARQSINTGSVGRWKNYAAWLGPLQSALDDAPGGQS